MRRVHIRMLQHAMQILENSKSKNHRIMSNTIDLTSLQAEIHIKHKHAINAIELIFSTLYREYKQVEWDRSERYSYITYHCVEMLTSICKEVVVKIDNKNMIPRIYKSVITNQ